MAKPQKDPGLTVADDVVRQLYADCDLVVHDSQPVFLLQRDTIKSFLHEKAGVIAAEARFLAYLSIELSLIAALVTATFQDFWKIKAQTIEGTFVAFTFIIGILMIRDGTAWVRSRKKATPDALTEELGSRGARITPKARNTEG